MRRGFFKRLQERVGRHAVQKFGVVQDRHRAGGLHRMQDDRLGHRGRDLLARLSAAADHEANAEIVAVGLLAEPVEVGVHAAVGPAAVVARAAGIDRLGLAARLGAQEEFGELAGGKGLADAPRSGKEVGVGEWSPATAARSIRTAASWNRTSAKDTLHRLLDVRGHLVGRPRRVDHGKPVRPLAGHRQEPLADLLVVHGVLGLNAILLAFQPRKTGRHIQVEDDRQVRLDSARRPRGRGPR